nr:MAG TPA: hypothetical protein [Caudoviricetes sp.]
MEKTYQKSVNSICLKSVTNKAIKKAEHEEFRRWILI